jgi:hypothetical protein
MYLRSKKDNFSEGLIAGAIGGLVASWIMPRFQSLTAHAFGNTHPHEGQGEDATVKTAQRISSALLGRELSPEEKKAAGPLVHYAYGTGIGALLGGLAQRHETTTSGFGIAYRAAAWALGDEVAVPALRLGTNAEGTTDFPTFSTAGSSPRLQHHVGRRSPSGPESDPLIADQVEFSAASSPRAPNEFHDAAPLRAWCC